MKTRFYQRVVFWRRSESRMIVPSITGGELLTYNQVKYRVGKGLLPKAYDTGTCQIGKCSKPAGVYDHCHIHNWVRGAICVDCNLSMGRFDAAMMHNSFYVVNGYSLAMGDRFIVDYY